MKAFDYFWIVSLSFWMIVNSFELSKSPIERHHHQQIMIAGRRDFMSKILTTTSGIVATTTLTIPTQVAQAAVNDDELIEVYFGCGCFWHVQHEFVEAERRILGRGGKNNNNDDDVLSITSRAGYAGGKAGMLNGKVCYHNAAQISDYGKLGHAEVVRLQIPSSSFPQFAKEYVALFNDKGYRPDQWGDVGLEYRNLVGIPGGVKSDYAQQLVQVSQANGDKLDFAKGKGDDPDARALCFIMDTADFPFYVAEQYHQFHDGFNWGEDYPNSYNSLASKLAKTNNLGESSCPNGSLGLGVLGL